MTASSEAGIVRIREGAVELLALQSHVAAGIVRLGMAQVTPWGDGLWRVGNVAKIGAVRIGDTEVRVEPKVPIRNLFHLLARGRSWGRWRDESLSLQSVDDLYPAIAEAFEFHLAGALTGGVVRGYEHRQEAATTVRGRLLIGEQLRRRPGLPLPVEISFDEFTADIPLNRILRSAVRRLVGSSSLPRPVRGRLLMVDQQLSEAGLLNRGEAIPPVSFDRRTERFRAPEALARLVLSNGSLDHRVGSTAARGFLLDLSAVFEQFVEAEVVDAVGRRGGWIAPQERTALDTDARVHIKPDLVWRDRRGVRAVLDAKYKAEKPAGFPNADIYQMLVYCVRHRLAFGHLVYAAGNEQPARYEVAEAGVTIVCHALALDRSASEISAQIERIIDGVAGGFAID